jgi:hypothetical protein
MLELIAKAHFSALKLIKGQRNDEIIIAEFNIIK